MPPIQLNHLENSEKTDKELIDTKRISNASPNLPIKHKVILNQYFNIRI